MAAIMGDEQYGELFVVDPGAAQDADLIPAKYRNPLGECFGVLDLFMEYEALPINPDPEDKKLEVQTAFCLENLVKLQKMEDAKKTYRSLRNSLMRSAKGDKSSSPSPSWTRVRSTRGLARGPKVPIGYQCRSQGARTSTRSCGASSWATSGGPYSVGMASQCLKTNVTIAAGSKRPWAPVFPWAMWKSMMRIDQKIFALSGVTKVGNPMWILDASEHYLKPDVLPPEMKAVWSARQKMLKELKELEKLGPDPGDYFRTY